MKTTYFIFFLALVLLSACGKNYPELVSNCAVELSFIDKDGKNLVEGILVRDDPKYDGKFIHEAIYDWTVHVNGKVSNTSSSMNLIFPEDNPIPQLRFSTIINPTLNKQTIVYEIMCPFIFGDSSSNKFIFEWELDKETKNQLCKKLIFNGNEIAVSYDNYRNKATIVLK